MDFGQSAMLVAALVGVVQLAKALAFGDGRQRINVGIAIGGALFVVFLVAESDFGTAQIIADRPLSELNVWSLLLVAVFLAGAASFGWETLTAVKNIGPPMPTKAQVVALDVAATKYASAQVDPNAGGAHPVKLVPLGETPPPPPAA